MFSGERITLRFSEPPDCTMRNLNMFQYVDSNSLRLAQEVYSDGLSLLMKNVTPQLKFTRYSNLTYLNGEGIDLIIDYLYYGINLKGVRGGFETLRFFIPEECREIRFDSRSNSRFARFGAGWEMERAIFSENNAENKTFNISEKISQMIKYDSSRRIF